MGDRANVYMKEGDTGVHLYTHWDGTELPEIVRKALIRGKDRWDDLQYMSRIIFCEMVKGSEMDTTGYGISVHLCDNEYDIVVVDTETETVTIGSTRWTFPAYVEQDEAGWPQ